MRSIQTFILLLFLCSFSGCLTTQSSKVDQSRISTNYTLHSDASDESVIGEVQFTTQKQTTDGWSEPVYIELDNSSAVYFDDLMMVENKNLFDQITYRKILRDTTRGLKTYSWRYVQNDGSTLVNSATPILFPTPAFSTDILSSKGFTLSWTLSEPIGKDQLQLMLNSQDQYPGYSVTDGLKFSPDSTSGEITVVAERLQSWTPKNQYFVQLCRRRDLSPQQLPAAYGGKLEVVSCSSRRQITLD